MKHVILIGLRGSGKTSIGAAVARRLARPHVDTDEQIEQVEGRSIREIFETDGEPAFREMETRTIEDALRNPAAVISVGGGAVLSAENRRTLRNAGTCIWLTAPAEELQRRLVGDARTHSQRPALTRAGVFDEMRHLLATRAPFYAETAHHSIDTTGRDIPQVVEAVLAVLGHGAT